MESNSLVKTINACRVCGFKFLDEILSLGDLYVTNFVDSEDSVQVKAPLDLVLCNKNSGGCGLLQLRHTFSQDKLYENYWYFSGMNKTMTDELHGIAHKAESMVDLKPGDFILDIGSNDSTLLRGFKTQGLNLIGFEPAKNLMPYATPGVTKAINDFFNYKAWRDNFGDTKAKIITAIAMFYDLDDPNTFLADVVKCLDRDGVFIVQQNYLPVMLERNIFDNISHEHLEYYSLSTLNSLLEKHNLEVFDIELNDVNGGSMRTYIRHKNGGAMIKFDGEEARKRVADIIKHEKNLNLYDRKTYDDFAERVNRIKNKLYSFIKQEVENGKKVYVYGASTRGNTLLQFCNVNHALITAAAERNPVKYGKKTVGTLIPIISEKQARAEKPDYFLILPWQFLGEFKKREIEFLKGGGKFIVPLPEFRILDKNDL